MEREMNSRERYKSADRKEEINTYYRIGEVASLHFGLQVKISNYGKSSIYLMVIAHFDYNFHGQYV